MLQVQQSQNCSQKWISQNIFVKKQFLETDFANIVDFRLFENLNFRVLPILPNVGNILPKLGNRGNRGNRGNTEGNTGPLGAVPGPARPGSSL